MNFCKEIPSVSSDKVDLSQIRGDWDFHSRYVTNAMEQTLKRVNKYWKELKKTSKKKGQVTVDGELMEEFIEAIMQARAITDDYLILNECKPSSKKAGKKKAKKKAKKKVAKKKTSKKTKKKAGGSK
jgi:hypothetical protein